MFTHETNLYIIYENITELFQQMNKELKSACFWLKANKLSININETKQTSKKRMRPTKFPELFIDGVTLKQETVTKVSSVFIDVNVTWKAHINTSSTTIYLRIGNRAKLIIPRK